MTFEPILEELAGLLDTTREALTPEAELAVFANWDSLTKVSLIAFVHERYELPVDGSLLDRVQTVGQLLAELSQLAPAAA